MNKTINPELFLAGAKFAKPEYRWALHARLGNLIQLDKDGTQVSQIDFSPLTSDSDAWALERALKHRGNNGWRFWQFQYGDRDNMSINVYVADCVKYGQITDPSDTLLLLKCVSAMTGLPLYLEDKQ